VVYDGVVKRALIFLQVEKIWVIEFR